jgi:hypothetical protein
MIRLPTCRHVSKLPDTCSRCRVLLARGVYLMGLKSCNQHVTGKGRAGCRLVLMAAVCQSEMAQVKCSHHYGYKCEVT